MLYWRNSYSLLPREKQRSDYTSSIYRDDDYGIKGTFPITKIESCSLPLTSEDDFSYTHLRDKAAICMIVYDIVPWTIPNRLMEKDKALVGY